MSGNISGHAHRCLYDAAHCCQVGCAGDGGYWIDGQGGHSCSSDPDCDDHDAATMCGCDLLQMRQCNGGDQYRKPALVGACRGPGGIHDKINSRFRRGGGITRANCQAACTVLSACTGFAFSASEGSCAVYGAGLDKGGVSPWSGDTHATISVVAANGNTAYQCFDRDQPDAPSPPPSAPQQQAAAAGTAVTFSGFGPPMQGGCRGAGGAHDRVNGRWRTSLPKLSDCAAACTGQAPAAACTGFAYSATANGGECVLYGPGLEHGAVKPWAGEAQPTTIVASANGNPDYRCWAVASPSTSRPTSGDEASSSSSSGLVVFGWCLGLIMIIIVVSVVLLRSRQGGGWPWRFGAAKVDDGGGGALLESLHTCPTAVAGLGAASIAV